MQAGKIVVARIWASFDGKSLSRIGVIKRLNPAKFETVCVYLSKISDRGNLFEEAGYKTFYLSDKEISRFSMAGRIWRLARLLREQNADIVHCHRHKATVIGTLAGILAGTPVIISQVHGLGRTRNLKRKLLNYFLFKRINKIITVGEAVKQDVLKCNPSLPECKVESEGNSIDYRPFLNIKLSKSEAKAKLSLPPDALVYGTVGRLAPTKGQEYLIRAFEIVKRTVHSAHLIFVGDGRLREELEEQALKTSVPDSIHFLGRRSDIPEVFRAMDVFVLPSVAEGMPRVLLEAMAAGVPCATTAVGGIPEIIDEGASGFLVPQKNEIALAEAMVRCAQTAESDRQRTVTAARERVRCCYTNELVAKKLEKVYTKVYEKYK